MAACFLLREEDDVEAVLEFLDTLEAGVDNNENDALSILAAIRRSGDQGPLPEGILGDVIAVMNSKLILDQLFEKLDMRVSQIRSVSALLSGRVDTNLQAKIMLKKIETVLGRCQQVGQRRIA